MKFKNIPIPAKVHKQIKSEAANIETPMYSLIVLMFEAYQKSKTTETVKNMSDASR